MLTVDYTRHAQTINHLFHSAIHSPHPRTRERFLALARIANGQSPVRVADDLGNSRQIKYLLFPPINTVYNHIRLTLKF